jgi:hypothetical protein
VVHSSLNPCVDLVHTQGLACSRFQTTAVLAAFTPVLLHMRSVNGCRLSAALPILSFCPAVEPWAGWFVVAAFAGILMWEQVWDLPGHAALSGVCARDLKLLRLSSNDVQSCACVYCLSPATHACAKQCIHRDSIGSAQGTHLWYIPHIWLPICARCVRTEVCALCHMPTFMQGGCWC